MVSFIKCRGVESVGGKYGWRRRLGPVHLMARCLFACVVECSRVSLRRREEILAFRRHRDGGVCSLHGSLGTQLAFDPQQSVVF